MVVTKTCEVNTLGQGDTHNLTEIVAKHVRTSGIQAGTATIFIVGSSRFGFAFRAASPESPAPKVRIVSTPPSFAATAF